MTPIELRPARPTSEDAAAFCGLYNMLYRCPVDEAYYLWQYFATPFPSLLCMAERPRGEPVGFYGIQVRSPDPQTPQVAWAIDAMTHPDHRRCGVFRELAGQAGRWANKCGMAAVLGMGNRSGWEAHRRGLGWQLVCVLRDFEAPCLRWPEGVVSPLELREVTSAPEGIESLALRSVARVVPRTRSYLDWRFGRHPQHKYRQFVVYDSDRLWGYFAIKTFKSPDHSEPVGNLVDIAWRDNDPDRIVVMIRLAMDRLLTAGVRRTSMWVSGGQALAAAAARTGFRTTNKERLLYGHALRPAGDRLIADGGNRLWTMADAERY